MVTTTSYGKLAWIGSLIVASQHRGQGLGTALMRQAMSYLQSQGIEAIRLDAVPLAISLYKRLGLQEEYSSLRFIGVARKIEARSSASSSIRALCLEDLPEVACFDAHYFGADRSKVLRRLQQDFPHLGFVAYYEGELMGYILARARKDIYAIGPWICKPQQAEIAEALLAAVLESLVGEQIWLGVPKANKASVKILKKHGFAERQASLHMRYGKGAHSGDAQGIFAIGAPKKG